MQFYSRTTFRDVHQGVHYVFLSSQEFPELDIRFQQKSLPEYVSLTYCYRHIEMITMRCYRLQET